MITEELTQDFGHAERPGMPEKETMTDNFK